MILVDTSVWIDFFANRSTPQVESLVQNIEQSNNLCLCGVILTEILQGITNHKELLQVEDLLESLIYIEMKRSTFLLAADVFRLLRKRGVTIRKTIDCLIAAVAIENNISLLHNDRDFDFIEKYTELKIIN